MKVKTNLLVSDSSLIRLAICIKDELEDKLNADEQTLAAIYTECVKLIFLRKNR